MIDKVHELPELFNAIVGGAAAAIIVWRILLPHMRKSIVGQMEPTVKKVNEIHQKTTVNHHSSDEPTILDLLDDVKELVLNHIEASNEHIARLDRLEAQQNATHPPAPSIMIHLPKLPFTGK